MQAQKIITRTDHAGRLVDIPAFQPMQQVELILLFSDPVNPLPHKRRPPEKLKGMLTEKVIFFLPHLMLTGVSPDASLGHSYLDMVDQSNAPTASQRNNKAD